MLGDDRRPLTYCGQKMVLTLGSTFVTQKRGLSRDTTSWWKRWPHTRTTGIPSGSVWLNPTVPDLLRICLSQQKPKARYSDALGWRLAGSSPAGMVDEWRDFARLCSEVRAWDRSSSNPRLPGTNHQARRDPRVVRGVASCARGVVRRCAVRAGPRVHAVPWSQAPLLLLRPTAYYSQNPGQPWAPRGPHLQP
jgi:hypothetical protein